jgi:MFS family permease
MARLAAFWFGLQFVWGAVLAVSLQARVSALVPGDAIDAYALLAAAGAIVGGVVQLIAGPLADRRFARHGSRAGFYAAGVALALPGLALLYLAPGLVALGAGFVLLQIGMNVATGPYQAIVPDYVPAERAGSASAWLGIFQPLGNSGGLLVAGFVHDDRLVAGIIAAALAGSWALTASALRTRRPIPAVQARFTLDADFRTLLLSRTAINFGFYTLLGFLFFFVAQSLGVGGSGTRTFTALLFLTFTLANVAGAALAARPADRYDKRFVVLAANALIVVALVALASAHALAVAFAAAALAGIAWGGYFIADWALACTLLPRSGMASAMGIWNVAAAIPQILAPIVTAPLVQHANLTLAGSGPRVAVVMAAVEFTLGAVWLLRLPRDAAAPTRSG